MINGVHSPCYITAEESPWKPCGFDSAEQQETAEEDRWGTSPESDQQEASKKQPQRGSHEISSLFLKERFVGHGHGPGAMGLLYIYIYYWLYWDIIGWWKWYQRLGKSMSSFDKNSKEPSTADAWVWIGIRTRAALRVQKVRARPIPSKNCHENWNRLGEALLQGIIGISKSRSPRGKQTTETWKRHRERERESERARERERDSETARERARAGERWIGYIDRLE